MNLTCFHCTMCMWYVVCKQKRPYRTLGSKLFMLIVVGGDWVGVARQLSISWVITCHTTDCGVSTRSRLLIAGKRGALDPPANRAYATLHNLAYPMGWMSCSFHGCRTPGYFGSLGAVLQGHQLSIHNLHSAYPEEKNSDFPFGGVW